MSALETKEAKPAVSESYHFEWTIRNFNNLMGIFKAIEKPFFPPETDSKHKWFFKVDEESKQDISYTYFSLYASEKLEKYVETSLYLKSLDHVYEFPFETNFVNSSNLLSFSLKTEELENHMKWKNGERPRDLTIICKICLVHSIQDFQKQKQFLKFNDNKEISDHRNSILNEDSIKDFSFVVQNQTIHVPKLLLALESPVFAAMFKSNMSEGINSEATIKDVEPEIFLKMIKFIYEQKVDQADLEELAPEILKVAHIYDVIKLKQICASFLYDKACIDNALEMLLLADLYSISGLKEKALKIIKLNFKLFKESEDFKKYIKEKPLLAVDLIEIKEESADYSEYSLGKTNIV